METINGILSVLNIAGDICILLFVLSIIMAVVKVLITFAAIIAKIIMIVISILLGIFNFIKKIIMAFSRKKQIEYVINDVCTHN
jgi:phage-related protein